MAVITAAAVSIFMWLPDAAVEVHDQHSDARYVAQSAYQEQQFYQQIDRFDERIQDKQFQLSNPNLNPAQRAVLEDQIKRIQLQENKYKERYEPR